MEQSSWLQDRCRVCAGRLARHKVSYDCHTDSSKSKLQAIGVTVTEDRKEIHPPRFCYGCFTVCTKKQKAIKEGRDYTPRLTKFDWGEHEGEAIPDQLKKVGRKAKKTPVGRPSHTTMDLVHHIKRAAPQSVTLDREMREMLSQLPSTEESLKCHLCTLVLDRPVQLTTCNALVCMDCCVSHVFKNSDFVCPCGAGHLLSRITIIPAPSVVLAVLNKMEVTCKNCGKLIGAGTQVNHCTMSIHYNPPPSPPVKYNDHVCTIDPPVESMQSVAEVVAKSLTDPLSHQEDKLVTSLVRRKLAQTSEEGVLQLKTGGQVKQIN